jgi:predicted DNA-binding protein with PD1-like motif
MKSIETEIKRVIVGKIEPGEDLIESIIQMIEVHDIKSGLINCIGALEKFTIGYFDIHSKKYLMKTIDAYVELVSCMGNIAFKDGEPVVHLHISVGTKDYNIIGGHLVSPSIISITGEVYIFEINRELERTNDPYFDLSLLNL